MNLPQKLGLIAALYISEGLPFGFFTQALPVLLRDAGHSLTHIGLTSLLALPWALKFLWAPMVDRYHSPRLGRRRSWLLPVQVATIFVLVFASSLDSNQHMAAIFAVVLVCNLLAATLDIATDGLAVELLKPSERGLGNGIQVAGYRVGMVISGGLLLMVFAQLGWSGSFLAMAALLTLLLIPVWRYQEPRKEIPTSPSRFAWDILRVPGMPAWLLVIFFYKFCEAIGAGMVKPWLVDVGLSLAEIGWLVGTLGFGASLVGALLGGLMASRLGHYPAMVIAATLQVFGILAFALISMNVAAAGPWLAATIVIEGLVSGMATAALFTLMMFGCRQGREGSDYTFQACVFVVAMGAATALSGWLADWLGYTHYFRCGAATASLAVLPILLAWRRGGFQALNQQTREVSQ